MRRRLLAVLGSLVIAGGVGLAAAPAASAEPSPGMARATWHCHFFWGGPVICHAGIT